MLDVLSENGKRDLYFVDDKTKRVTFLPKDWAHEIVDENADEDGRSAYCWIGNEDTLGFLERESGEWLTTDSQAWILVSDLAEMREVTEDEARQLDPDLFRLLDAVNSGVAK